MFEIKGRDGQTEFKKQEPTTCYLQKPDFKGIFI